MSMFPRPSWEDVDAVLRDFTGAGLAEIRSLPSYVRSPGREHEWQAARLACWIGHELLDHSWPEVSRLLRGSYNHPAARRLAEQAVRNEPPEILATLRHMLAKRANARCGVKGAA